MHQKTKLRINTKIRRKRIHLSFSPSTPKSFHRKNERKILTRIETDKFYFEREGKLIFPCNPEENLRDEGCREGRLEEKQFSALLTLSFYLVID